MNLRRSAVVAALLSAALAAPSLSVAQGDPPATEQQIEEARQLFERAEAHRKLQQYAEAARGYLAAHELYPVPDFLFNAAQALRMDGARKEAIANYRRYLDAAPDGEAAEDARRYIVELTRELEEEGAAQPPDPQLPATEAGAGVVGGDPTGSAHPRDAGDSGRVMKLSGLAVGGVGLVSLAIGIKFGLDARSAERELEGLEPPAQWDEARFEDGKQAQRIAIISTGVGVAAMVGGGVLYLLGVRDSARGEGSLSVVPAVSDSAAGLTVMGRF